MKFVLLRHAQKGITPYADPELTKAGFDQADAILTLVKQNLLPAPTHAWASPKIRTYQTLRAVCEDTKVRIEISDLLDQRESHESLVQFRHRIQSFLDSFSQNGSDEIHFICTHYDWIGEAITLINSDKDLNTFEFSHWSPAQFVMFEITAGHWKFLRKGTAAANKVAYL